MREELPRFLWICLGGAAGTGARYLVSGWMAKSCGLAFPYGTLLVNLAGSLLIGAIMHASLASEVISPTARIALTVGVLGGFTTYSTFSYETLRYLEDGALGLATVYVTATVLGCLGGCMSGVLLAKWWIGS